MQQPELQRQSYQLRQLRQETRRLRRGRKPRRTGRIVTIILGSILGALVIGMTAGWFWLRSLETKMQIEPKERVKIEKVVAKPKGESVNALLVGTDLRPGWNSSRADTIVFIRADKTTKKTYLLSIPRDSRVAIPGRGLDKINHAWAFGGPPLLIRSVSDFTGQPVNYYFQVDFSRFEKAVDALGGVDFSTQIGWYDGELGVQVRPGLQHRYGKEALAIMRNRKFGAGGDYNRVNVQQQFLQAMVAQSIKSYTDVPRVAGVVASYVNTNMVMGEMLGLGRAFAGQGLQMETAVVPGRGAMINGVSYVIPDTNAKDALVSAMLNNQPFPK